MASLGDVFSDPDMTNWLKAWLALNITKDGIQHFVDNELAQFKNTIYQTVLSKTNAPLTTTCSSCFTANVVKCPTRGVCKRIGKLCKSLHVDPSKQSRQCPNRICDDIRDEIMKGHRHTNPSWKNTSAEKWAHYHWEVAKCFMPPDGYLGVSSIQDTDFNGIISVMLNCKHFDNKMSFIITPQPPSAPCFLSKARDIGKAVRHSSTCKVTGVELQDFYATLIAILSDSLVLSNDDNAQDAIRKLKQLQQENLNISLTEVSQLLKDAQNTITKAEQVSAESMSEMQAYIVACKTQLDMRTEHLHLEYKTKLEKDFQSKQEECTKQIDMSMQNRHEEYKKKIEEHARSNIANSKKEIDQYTQSRVDSIQKASAHNDESTYKSDMQEFRRRLIQHYLDSLQYVSVSPLMTKHDISLKELYVTPAIHRIETDKSGKRMKTDKVYKYKHFFNHDKKHRQRIFLQGEPGKGKSTFAAKLVLDWCQERNSLHQSAENQSNFDDVETLQEYTFVFHIALREAKNQRKVTEIIKNQIIEMLYAEKDVEKAYLLLQNIMDKETCLVVQDGLDEWSDPKKQFILPFVVGSAKFCSAFTTSRSWKMCDDLLKDSKVECLLEIDGVEDPFVLCKSILQCIISENLNIKYIELKNYITKEERLMQVIENPMLLTIIVCLWVDDTYLTGSSSCEIYSILLDSLFKKSSDETDYFQTPPFKCFENTKHIQPNIGHMDSISKAAFCLLFSFEKESSLVFSDKELSKHLPKKEKMFALTSGLLSEDIKSTLSYRPTTCSFIHKSVQEFLAAIHISHNVKVIADILSQYLKRVDNAYYDLSEVLKFLCGLNVVAANDLSRVMDTNCVVSPVYDGDFDYFQTIIMSGYWEAKANACDEGEIALQLSHFNFERHNECDLESIREVLLKNKTHVRTLKFHSHMCEDIQFPETAMASIHSLNQLVIRSS